ncbi:MAG: hypothetical protein ACJ796_08895 [Gemmatimonadaceae bacterium]
MAIHNEGPRAPNAGPSAQLLLTKEESMRNLTNHTQRVHDGAAAKDRRVSKSSAPRSARSLRADAAPPSSPASLLGIDADGTPIVPARRVGRRDNDLLIVDRCAFGEHSHVHGACGKGSPFGAGDGYRTADCGGGEYCVREVAANEVAA